MKKFTVLRQYLVPHHLFNRFAGWLSNRRLTYWKNWQIRFFIRRYQVDISSAIEQNIDSYPTFNHFFIRALRPEARPIVSGHREVACPVDGFVSQIGRIHKDTLIQAKGVHFHLAALLGCNQLASLFADGSFATLYLSPRDYHRVHMPIAGRLQKTLFIPGSLYSVNPETTVHIPNLFAKNERLVCLFDTEIGPMALIFVGAMIVGSIKTVWDAAPIQAKQVVTKSYTEAVIRLPRGKEVGHFQLGSTVIVLFAKDKVTWNTALGAESCVKMGQLLGTI